MSGSIPDERVNSFHVGQVWESSRGYLWTVVDVQYGQATLRQGVNCTGRKKRMAWDAVVNMVLFYDPEYHEGTVREKWAESKS